RARGRALARGRRRARSGGDARRQRRRPARRRPRAGTPVRPPLRHRRPRARPPGAAARSRLEVLPPLRRPLRLRAGVRRPPGRVPLPQLRARAPAPGRRRPRGRARGARRLLVRARHAGRLAPRAAPPRRSLQRLQRAGGGIARDGARRLARRRRGGPPVLPGRLRASRADRGGRPRSGDAARQEPGGRERGGADPRRRRRPARAPARPQRRDRGRPGRLVDLGRRPGGAARAGRAARPLRRPGRRARAALRLRRLPATPARARAGARAGARPGARARAGGRTPRRAADVHRDAAPARARSPARSRPSLLGGDVRIRVAHLYPEYLNIYADRGNIAVLARRAALRGHELEVEAIGVGTPLEPGEHDLVYVGGGQDREQALIAPDLAARADALTEAVAGGAALLAVCGGYQLLGRGYRGRDGSLLPGAGLFPHETVAGERRMIGDVLLECELVPGERRTLAGFENHAGRTRLDPGAEPLGRVLAGFGNDGESGLEGCRVG